MNTQDHVLKLKEMNEAAEVAKLYKLSQKSAGLAAVLTLVMTILGYAYTGRWAQFAKIFFGGIILGAIMTVGFGATGDQVFMTVGLIASVVGAVDNFQGVEEAKKKIAGTV